MSIPQKTKELFWKNLNDPRHGTAHGYKNLKCRCDRCRQANSRSQANYRTSQAREGRLIYWTAIQDENGEWTPKLPYLSRTEAEIEAAKLSKRYHRASIVIPTLSDHNPLPEEIQNSISA